MVSIVAFQAMDPGSIPGRRIHFEVFSNIFHSFTTSKKAQVYAAKIGLKTITKSRAFVDNFMRANDIRISDTPYAIRYN